MGGSGEGHEAEMGVSPDLAAPLHGAKIVASGPP
jgi:hypothetical protein